MASLLLSFPIWAQLQFENLDEILDYADRNSLTAKAANINEQAVEKDEKLYRSTLLPRLDLVAATDYNVIIPSMVVPEKLLGGAEGEYSTIRFGLPFTFTPALEFSMPLIHQQKWQELKKYALEKERARHNTGIQLEQLHIQLAQAYFNALAAKELLAVSAESKRTVAQLLSILEMRKKEGVLPPVDYNRAKLLSADIENSAVNWQLLLTKSIDALHQLLDIPSTDTIILVEKPVFNWRLAEIT